MRPSRSHCHCHSEENCAGTRSDPIVWPGYSDLTSPLIAFHKKARSWRCWKWCGYASDTVSSTGTSATTHITHTISVAGVPAVPGTGPPEITRTLSSSDLSASDLSTPSASSAQITDTVTWEVVQTHTYADGNVTVLTTNLAS